MSKYTIRKPYYILTDSRAFRADTYNLIRQLRRAPTVSTISVAIYKKDGRVEARVKDSREGGSKHIVRVPMDGSTCPGTLLINMGTHTIEEVWDMYYETWAEEIESQVQGIPMGDGP